MMIVQQQKLSLKVIKVLSVKVSGETESYQLLHDEHYKTIINLTEHWCWNFQDMNIIRSNNESKTSCPRGTATTSLT